MKKIWLFSLCISLLFLFGGCSKDDAKVEEETTEITAEETISADTSEDSLLGTWVVKTYEVYDGPLKREFEEQGKVFYFEGAEYTFTEDGRFTNADGSACIQYEVLDGNQISASPIGSTEKLVYDYVLDGDNLILYGCYTGDFEGMGYPCATYFTRK